MTDERRPYPEDEEQEELGAPILELRDLASDPSPGFLRGIRNRIERRATAGQLLDLALPALGRTLMEYVSMLFALFGGTEDTSKRKDEQNG